MTRCTGSLVKLTLLLALLIGALGVVGFMSANKSTAQEAVVFDQADLDQLKSVGTAYFAATKNTTTRTALRDELKAFGEYLEQKYGFDGTKWCIHTKDSSWIPYQCVQ